MRSFRECIKIQRRFVFRQPLCQAAQKIKPNILIYTYRKDMMKPSSWALKIKDLVSEVEPKLIEYRRHLHQYPELGYEEFRTAAFISECLQGMGLPPRTGVGGTGVVVEIGNGDSTVGFRCDMDALPIQEKTGAAYASKHSGKMHACGHDVHSSIGLGVAHVLQALGDELPGKVRLLFQPAEELMPGGSVDMIRDGAIEGLQAIYSVHVDPSIPAGSVGLRYGPLLASVDTFELTITGKMGHAAHPHLAIDPIPIAAQVITALHELPSRKINPIKPVVISVTMVHAGNAKNVLPESVQLAGTFRTLDREVRDALPGMLEQTISGICRAFGAKYQFDVEVGSPVLVNDGTCMGIMEKACREMLGEAGVRVLPEARMGAEDFANYLEYIPGAMIRLGTYSDERTGHSIHSPYFDVDERAIGIGVQVIAAALVKYLER